MKGVIVAAGYGSRFLPLTKTMPKEMLPLFDRPILDFILDEFEEAGIEDVVIITSRRKKVLDDYLDREVELETVLTREGKTKLAEAIRPRNMNFSFIRQTEMKGTGHALLLTRPLIGNSPFVVAYPDDIVLGTPGVSKAMCGLHANSGKNILAVRHELENPSRFGVIDPETNESGIRVKGIVEKPAPGTEPSNMVSIGRYLFNSELLDMLAEAYPKHTGGEFYHIGAINELAAMNRVEAYPIEGLMLDTGEPASYFLSTLLYAEKHPVAGPVLKRFIESRK